MKSLPLLAVALASGLAASAAASELENVAPVRDAATREECGECHMAFQPGLLPAGAWRRAMDGLADHFGEDASLAPELAAEIRAYLAANAAPRGDDRILRITEQRWWLREHRFRDSVWRRPEVGAKSNCVACHDGAEQGIYEDD